MDSNQLLITNTLMDEKLCDLFSPITLELHDGTVFLVNNDRAVAIESLLEVLEDFIETELGWNTRYCCETFSTVSLLRTDIYRI
jgi:hypothetical protein